MSDEKKRMPPSGTLSRARAAIDHAPEEPAIEPAAAPVADDPSAEERDETGGPEGPDPTRYGDWERKGRCIDF